MLECTFISKRPRGHSSLTALALVAALTGFAVSAPAFAQSTETGGGKVDRTAQPEEEDFLGTPFTEYGEFSNDDEESSDQKFFQYGRLFGVSLGVGFEGATGNRGLLWQGGFPMIDFKVHYWFDFNFAIDLGFSTASHSYTITSPKSEHSDITLSRLGIDLKYYFDTKDLAAPISFANPYVMIGGGSYSKNEVFAKDLSTAMDNAFGFSAGAGLEFAIKPKKVYFNIESKIHVVTFKDTNTADFQPNIKDQTGLFYSTTAGLLFTW